MGRVAKIASIGRSMCLDGGAADAWLAGMGIFSSVTFMLDADGVQESCRCSLVDSSQEKNRNDFSSFAGIAEIAYSQPF